MSTREFEDRLLDRCVAVACKPTLCASDSCEANVFRVAGMVLQSRFPLEASNLMRVSDNYFSTHATDKLLAAAVVQQGWIASLPRLRDMLSQKLQCSVLP